MEDFITWVDSSKIKRKVLEYNDKLDDYDAMNCWNYTFFCTLILVYFTVQNN